MIESTETTLDHHSFEPFHPKFVQLDDRSIEELIYVFLQYAKQIPFVDDNGTVAGSWDEFYNDDILFLWVEISLLDLENIDLKKKKILELWFDEGEEKLINLMDSVLGILKSLYTKAGKVEADWVNSEIISVIRDSLFINIELLSTKFSDRNVATIYSEMDNWYNWLFDKVETQHEVESLRNSNTQESKNIIKNIIDDAVNCLLVIQNKLKNVVNKDVISTGNHPAHIGLLFGFLKSYGLIQDQINLLPVRHIDYYYKTILKQNPLEAQPDFAYIFMKILPIINKAFMKEGTMLNAGQDENGTDVIFELANDIQITTAKITEIRTLLIDKNKKVLPLEEANMVTGMYMDTISEDRIETKLFDNKSWPLFGEQQGYNSQKELPNFGWAVASPVFYLKGGKRTITLSFKLKKFKKFKERIKLLMKAYDIAFMLSEVEVFHLFVKSAFEIQITTPEGWLLIESYMIAFQEEFNKEMNAFIFQFTLPPDFPAWVPYQNTIHGETYDTILPLATFKLKQDNIYYPYSLLEHFRIESLDIDVDVKEFNDLVAYNKHGLMDLSNAVPILGMNPLYDNSFYLGALEWHSKNITSLKCNINWIDLPKPNFQDYYKNYASHEFTDECFTISLCDPSSETINENLFKLTNGILQNKSEFEFENLNKSVSSDIIHENELFNPKESPLGFVGFKLTGPHVGFGSAIYHDEMALYGKKIIQKSKSKQAELPPQKPFVPIANTIEVDYKSTHNIAFESKSIGGLNETFDFYHIHPHGVLKEGTHKKVKNNYLIPNDYGERGYLYIGLDDVNPYMEVSIFLKIVPSLEQPTNNELMTIEYLSGNAWKDFKERLIENSTYQGQESGILRLFMPLDIESDHPFFDKNKNWIRISIDSDNIKYIGKCNYINTNVGLVRRKVLTGSASFSTLNPFSISSLVSKNESIQSLIQPFHSIGGKLREEDKKFYARVSNRLGHKNRMVRPRDYRRMIMEKFSEVNWIKVLTASQCSNENHHDFTEPGLIRLIVMPKIEVTGDRSTFYVKKKTQREIEEYVKAHCSPSIQVKVESPDYEDVEVRCKLIRKNMHEYIPYSEIRTLVKKVIAPWLFYEKMSFKHVSTSFSVGNLVHAINQHPNVKDVEWCQIIHVSKDSKHPKTDKVVHYNFNDSYNDGAVYSGRDIIEPTNGKAILIPSKEFRIYQSDIAVENPQNNDNEVNSMGKEPIDQDYGYNQLSIGNMDIGKSFILSNKEKSHEIKKDLLELAKKRVPLDERYNKKKSKSSDKKKKKLYFINLKEIIKK